MLTSMVFLSVPSLGRLMTFMISDLSLERDVSVKCYIWVTMTELDLNSRADGW